MQELYIRLEDLETEGRRLGVYRRLSDNKQAVVKAGWFKQTGAVNNGFKVLRAKSRVRALRLDYFIDWYDPIKTQGNTQ